MNIIDLHLTPEIMENPFYRVEDSLYIQLSIFEKELDNAILQNRDSLMIIHGIGNGKLKSEIHKILSGNKMVKEFKNNYHALYGNGATIVYF